MQQNTLLSLNEDPTLPDLIPEDLLFDDLLRVNESMMPLVHPDVVELGRKLDSLTIEVNTQGLRLEIEKVKRQRLQASIRQVKRELVTMSAEINEIRNELKHFKDSQNAINYQLDGENARTNTLAFRSLARICEILTSLMPSISLSPGTGPEVKILLQELATTIQHFSIHYPASYV